MSAIPTLDPTFGYDPDLAPGYWIPARSDFLRTPALSPTAKLLYLLLCSYAGQGETAWPGKERLAGEMPCGIRTLDRHIDELARAGLLSVTQRGLNKTNLYYVHRLPTLTADRPKWPVKTRQTRRPKSAELAPESDSAELDSGESLPPENQELPPLPPHVQAAQLAFAARLRR